jgi:hypothetical protein
MNGNETLGPAERIIQTLLAYSGHMVHNRPMLITPDAASPVGIKCQFCTHKVEEGDKKVVYLVVGGKRRKGQKGNQNTKVGTLWADGTVRTDDRHKIGRYQPPGLLPEVAVWMYKQVAEVWKLDNEFAARWASYAFSQEHKDLKVVLAAFMLVQSRKGDPVLEDGKVVFNDEDFREVGEAMFLTTRPDKKHFDARLIKRTYDLLSMPEVAELNRELGFGRSTRKRALGRWSKAVCRWLQYRELNLPWLQGLVKSGNKETVKKLVKCAGFKPSSPKFYEILGWDQKQAKDGRRSIAVGETFKAESWEGLTEEQVCVKIMADKPNFKRITGFLPKGMGLTRAIVAAAIEAGSLSDKELVIHIPLLEELGLHKVQDIRERMDRALKAAEDQRTVNIARNVKSKGLKDKLQQAADTAVQKAVEEQTKDIEAYFFVDISSSMQPAIEAAKSHLEKFIHGFPPEKLHVAVFNTAAREVKIKHQSAAGVQQAFRGIVAGGGTSYAAGVNVLQHIRPSQGSDALFVFVGDEEDFGGSAPLVAAVRASGLNPMSFGLIRLRASNLTIVQDAAVELGVPCFKIDEATFEDPYAIPRTIRNLVAATPVGQKVHNVAQATARVSLVDQILQTELLRKPVWATAVAATA